MASSKMSVSEANSRASNEKRFLFQSILGQGSFGTVMKAKDKVTGDLVAIKIVKTHSSLLDRILKRRSKELAEAHQEVDMLLKLSHKNVLHMESYYEFRVKLKEVGLCIVTEYCSNGNLQQYLSSNDSKPGRDDCMNWYLQLTSGLAYIHSKGIVHRDLKPPNILITSSNDLKIADVGLAKAVWDLKTESNEAPSDTSFLHYMSSITGTPCYMAPEVWEEHYNTSSDVFSLALIFIMIREAPSPLLPVGKWNERTDSIGLLLYRYPDSRLEEPVSLFSPSFSVSDQKEKLLFNKMLQYDYHKRPTLQEIMTEIEDMRRPRPQELETTSDEDNGDNSSWCVII
ncbi:PREDICTED: serine/threonine-protein kinase PDIK1L-like [Amphimedon queenslandica]|uniref:Protein kinase domain-containing protein n=1 Tax=Amphimedon queenslandica TaxID=400682 RepID=A0A1X7VQD9_AMPQE|nr:PREDICTED: serine/threonine-protein kinase PDIK1L-like [Amphimedon queenslandica]|eukprot:XP_003383167.1 PREDICTED: serine/threonine-protein kinase PDIK1L-like [Amphimedon queenslandica]